MAFRACILEGWIHALQGPLDDEEQEQLIQEFERLQLEQTRTYRVCSLFASFHL